MQIVSTYDIASANLALALNENAVSVEHREAIKAAVGDNLDNMIDAVNTVVVAYNRLLYAGKVQPKKAALAVKSEYREMGFNQILDYSYLEGAVEIFYDRANFPSNDTLERIKSIFHSNEDCPIPRIKAGVDSFCLRLLTNGGLVTQDLMFTKDLMKRINLYSRELMDTAILPPAIVTEL